MLFEFDLHKNNVDVEKLLSWAITAVSHGQEHSKITLEEHF